MDPFHLCIALGPVGVYLLLIGLLNLSTTPFVTNGARDLMVLAIAISGFAIVGPMELFMPEPSANYFRGWIWLPLIALYFLVALLVSMIARPRIVIYNVTIDQLRSVLGDTAKEMDDDSRWAGESLALPSLGVQLFIQGYPGLRNVQLVAAGGEQNLNSWKRLEAVLRHSLKSIEVGRNPRGFSAISVAIVMFLAIAYSLIYGHESIADRMQEFFRF